MIINISRTAVSRLQFTGVTNSVSTNLLCSCKSYPAFTHARATYAKKADLGGVASLGKASKKKLGKLGPMLEKKILPVEEDPNKLVNYVCGSNILKEGGDVQVKPDSEYPEWLWSIRTGKAPTLEEMDPETKQYWQRVRAMAMKRNNQLAKLKKF